MVFTIYALSTFSGEDVTKPYLRGLEYNKTLAARAAQESLGWSVEIDAARDGDADVVVSRTHRGSTECRSGFRLEATLRRPTNASLDRTIALEARAAGTIAEFEGVSRGQWDVIARATSGDGDVFEAQRRIVLQ